MTTDEFKIFNVFKYASLLFLWIPWGIGLIVQGIVAFDAPSLLIGKGWEERKVQEFLEEDEEQHPGQWE